MLVSCLVVMRLVRHRSNTILLLELVAQRESKRFAV